MRPLRCLVVAATLTCSSLAAADETPLPAAPVTDVSALSVSFTGNVARVYSNYEPIRTHYDGGGFQVAIDYRISETLSVGGVGSHAYIESGARFSRFAAEARYHVVHRRFLDVWGGAELGAAIYDYEPPWLAIDYGDSGSGGAASSDPPTTRVAPMAALGAGLDFLPVRYVSIGLEGRVLGSVFSTVRDAPSGFTPTAFFGLTLGLHIPTSS